jgi:hypothetical protein
MVEEQLLARVERQGRRLREQLCERLGAHPHVGDIRGRGLLQGIELVADRATRRPFPPERRLHARIRSAALACGLMCYPGGGTIDGTRGDHVLLAPPYVVTDSELELIVERLAAAIEAALATADQAAA